MSKKARHPAASWASQLPVRLLASACSYLDVADLAKLPTICLGWKVPLWRALYIRHLDAATAERPEIAENASVPWRTRFKRRTMTQRNFLSGAVQHRDL